MIAAKLPAAIMKDLQDIYTINEESIVEPDYYLGNDYKKDKKGCWCIGCKKYLKKAVLRVKKMYAEMLKKFSVPMTSGDHPELGDTTILNNDGHKKYKMLIGMLNWIVTIGRLDVCHAASSLARFTASPRQGHLQQAKQVFGYLKKQPDRRIVVNSREFTFLNCEADFKKDYLSELQEAYPDACKKVWANVPESRSSMSWQSRFLLTLIMHTTRSQEDQWLGWWLL
jgi:hypothetical protein